MFSHASFAASQPPAMSEITKSQGWSKSHPATSAAPHTAACPASMRHSSSLSCSISSASGHSNSRHFQNFGAVGQEGFSICVTPLF